MISDGIRWNYKKSCLCIGVECSKINALVGNLAEDRKVIGLDCNLSDGTINTEALYLLNIVWAL